ncbi:MAG: PHP domain-containing protein [Synergistales bacterium]|nr:PHP domain-containing protein [Synergistales bacterium]
MSAFLFSAGMRRCVDLHLHSKISDGVDDVCSLVGRLAAEGVETASLTDHDTVAGVPAFLVQTRRWGIEGIPGVELTARFPGVLHILGFCMRIDHPDLDEALHLLGEWRHRRSLRIVEALRSQGCSIQLEELRSESGGWRLTRSHFARALVRQGCAPTRPAAFRRYLSDASLTSASDAPLSPNECIQLIRRCGGYPVLAHPELTRRDCSVFEQVQSGLVEAGLWGIEVYNPRMRPDRILYLLKRAGRYGLAVTAGSDFHGDADNGRGPGLCVEAESVTLPRYRPRDT